MQRSHWKDTERRPATNQEALPCIWTRALKYSEHFNRGLLQSLFLFIYLFILSQLEKENKKYLQMHYCWAPFCWWHVQKMTVFHSLTSVSQRKDLKMNYTSFCFSSLSFNLQIFTVPEYLFPDSFDRHCGSSERYLGWGFHCGSLDQSGAQLQDSRE